MWTQNSECGHRIVFGNLSCNDLGVSGGQAWGEESDTHSNNKKRELMLKTQYHEKGNFENAIYRLYIALR